MNAIVSNNPVETKPVDPTPAEMRVVVDDGTREVPIYNKFGKLICNVYFRPADFSIIDRYNEMKGKIEGIVEPLKGITLKNDGTAKFDADWAVLKKVESDIKREFDNLFDMEQADEIFAKRNAFSSVGGQFFALRVFDALGGVIEQAVSEEAALSRARLEKYLTPAEITKDDDNAGDTADNA